MRALFIKYVICAPAESGSLLFWLLVFFVIFGLDKSFPIIWVLLGLWPAKHPSEWLAILIGLGGIESKRIELKTKIELEIFAAICESCLSFSLARWLLPGSKSIAQILWNCSVERISRVAIYDIRVILISMGKCPCCCLIYLIFYIFIFWSRPGKDGGDSPIRPLLGQLLNP